MIMNSPATPTRSGLAMGLPVSSSHIPKNMGNIMMSAFVVASVLFVITIRRMAR